MVLAPGLQGAAQLMLCGSSWVRRGQLSPGTARGKVWNVEMKERGQMREVCVALGSEPPPALGKLGAIIWLLLLEAEFGGKFGFPWMRRSVTECPIYLGSHLGNDHY